MSERERALHDVMSDHYKRVKYWLAELERALREETESPLQKRMMQVSLEEIQAHLAGIDLVCERLRKESSQ